MFEWRQYLVLADSLCNKCTSLSNEEACLRAAISRGYYAAFCTARNFARDKEGLVLQNNGGDHSSVKKFYMNAPDSKRKQVGVLLNRLRDYRNSADYKDVVSSLESSARTALMNTRRIVDLLDEIYPAP